MSQERAATAGLTSEALWRRGAGLLDVHRVISLDGLGAARMRSVTKQQRAAVNAAASVLSARAGEELHEQPCPADDVLYASLLVTGLPHKSPDRLAGGRHWEHDCLRARLRYEGGALPDGSPAGVPYGAKARMVLLYLQTQALHGGTPVVELGPSMHAWLQAMSGQALGGMTYKIIREQAARLFACRVRLEWKDDAASGPPVEGPLVSERLYESGAGRSCPLRRTGPARQADDELPERVVLSEPMFRAIGQCAVRVRRSAVRRIGHNGTAIDQYLALSQRLPLLREPVVVTWPALAARFGASYKRFSQMRPRYLDALRLALAVYPEARVDVVDAGLVLHPSAPAA